MSGKQGAPITLGLGEAPINLLSVLAESYHQIVIHKLLVRYFQMLCNYFFTEIADVLTALNWSYLQAKITVIEPAVF